MRNNIDWKVVRVVMVKRIQPGKFMIAKHIVISRFELALGPTQPSIQLAYEIFSWG